MDTKTLLWLAALGAGGYLLYEGLSKKKPVKVKPKGSKTSKPPISPQRKAEMDKIGQGMNVTPANIAMQNLPANIGEDMAADFVEDALF